MWSVYNITTESRSKDILQLFATFDWKMWSGVIASLAIMTALLICGRRLLQNLRGILQPIWIVCMFMLDQDYLHEVNAFLYIISTTLSFFCFFIIQYLLGSMSTDLVVYDDIPTVQSYDDLMRREDVTAIFFKHFPGYERFRDASEGTFQHKIWQRFLDSKTDLLSFKPENVKRHILQVIQQKEVLIAKCHISSFAKMTTRVLKGQEDLFRDSRILRTPVPEPKVLGAYQISKGTERVVREYLSKRVRRAFEAGLPSKILKDATHRSFVECPLPIVESVQRQEPPFTQLSIKYMYQTLWLMAGAVVVSCLVLLGENVYAKIQKVRRQKLWRKVAQKALRKERREQILQRLMEIQLKLNDDEDKGISDEAMPSTSRGPVECRKTTV